MRNVKLIWIILATASLATIGCASTSKKSLESTARPTPILAPAEGKSHETYRIQFPKPLVVLPSVQVKDENDPREIVEFALMLYEKQVFLKAAHFFLEAEGMVPAENELKGFRVACLGAAALSFLNANEIESFVSVMKRSRELTSTFESADPPPEMVVLEAIAGKMEGKQVTLDAKLPYHIERLFK